MKNRTISILGGGNLGLSIAEGLIRSGMVDADNLIVTDRPIPGVKKRNIPGVEITYDNVEAVKKSDYLFFCVQPKQLYDLLDEIKDSLEPERHVILSTVTGFHIKKTLELVGKELQVFRIMPNTAISICESMTCISTNTKSEALKEEIANFFDKLGETIFISEELMASSTVLAGSGIAFAHRYIRAASQGGIEIGFDSETAQYIAAQTVKGAASLLLKRGYHPEREIDKVTTPQGVTISGLNEMEHQGFSSALIKGLLTSFNKIRKIT
jgi:pyrroline-5-carboxylate reductase